MFSFFNKHVANFDVIVGPDSKVKGDIESEGSVRLDGALTGSVKSKGEVIVTEKSVVEGNIVCVNTDIYGKCTGNIETYGSVNLHANSIMKGDIKAESFRTEKGCEFSGNCQINPKKQEQTTKNENKYEKPAKATSNSESVVVDSTKSTKPSTDKNNKPNSNKTDKASVSKAEDKK